MTQPFTIRSLADAVALIRDGDIVAIGGMDGQHEPMALVREIIRQNRRRLHLVACGDNIALDLLVRAGCAATVEMPGRPTNAGRERGIALIPHTAHAVMARLRAGAEGLPFMPLSDENGAALPTDSPYRASLIDPFTREPCMAVSALRPDVAIIHAEAADPAGRVRLGPAQMRAVSSDAILARAAARCVVSVEQVVTPDAIRNNVAGVHLEAGEVFCVAEAPYGAYPGGCEPLYRRDADRLARLAETVADAASLQGWSADGTEAAGSHDEYLNAVGAQRLLAVSLDRAVR